MNQGEREQSIVTIRLRNTSAQVAALSDARRHILLTINSRDAKRKIASRFSRVDACVYLLREKQREFVERIYLKDESKNIGGTKRVSRGREAELAEKRASMNVVGRGTGKVSRQGVGKTKKVLETKDRHTERERERERERRKKRSRRVEQGSEVHRSFVL